MGHFFRSEDICLTELIIPSNSVYESVGVTGEIGWLQFRDLNENVNPFQRNFVKEIRKCDQLERILRYFASSMENNDICEDCEMLIELDAHEKYALPLLHEIDEMEIKLMDLEKTLKEMEENEKALRKNYVEVQELECILKESFNFFDGAERRALTADSFDIESNQSSVKLGFVTGVIDRDKIVVFEKVLWRSCRGNVFLRKSEIEEPLIEPSTLQPVLKDVFVVFFQGEVLENKVKRVCDGFHAKLYSCPEPFTERCSLQERVKSSLNDLDMVLERTINHKLDILTDISRQYEGWIVCMRKVKATYFILNQFNYDVTNSALIGEAWCPVDRIKDVNDAMEKVRMRVGNPTPTIIKRKTTKDQPPTYHITNKVTNAFQTLIDSYGVGTYKEINPALFTLISFPFLFAVMFGDIAHGFLMFSFAFWMILREDSLSKIRDGGEFWDTAFGGRYVIVLMGAFSIYTGFIYNDIFSKALWMFSSGWRIPLIENPEGFYTLANHLEISTVCDNAEGCGYLGTPYVFGIDPIWSLSENRLSYMNSFKMKASIVIGVIHMLFGVILSALNYRHFKQHSKLLHEFIPQFIFMFNIFGYLVLLIIVKWLSTYPPLDDNTQTDPALLIILIHMFLRPGDVSYAEHTYIYKGQGIVQAFLILSALCCVPWMLLVDPLIKRSQAQQSATTGYGRLQTISRDDDDHDEESLLCSDDEEEYGHGHIQDNGNEEEFNFGEVMVKQSIHTIEYCLGAISNTASYLRLWALSLAHAQLSEVIWNMVFIKGLSGNYAGSVTLYLCFGLWAVLTVGVLLCMEGMSAFLHALRLHWVEFNGKFYHGEGYLFTPFSFKVVVHERKE